MTSKKIRFERFCSSDFRGVSVDNSRGTGAPILQSRARRWEPSNELAAITGSGQIARGDVVSRMWDYIKKNKLQNPENKREILADEKLEKIFGKKKVTMFEMNKHLSRHLRDEESQKGIAISRNRVGVSHTRGHGSHKDKA